MEYLEVDDEAALDRAVAALRAGGTVVLPTDTVYGLASLPEHQDQLAASKGRPEAMPIAVLVADPEQAWSLVAGGSPSSQAAALATAYWPGPLTLVLPTDAGPTIGIRCPAAAFVQELARRVGPIATTSANRHGEPTPATASAAAVALDVPPELLVDGGPCEGVASTVVDVTGSSPLVLREGSISAAAIRDVLS
jgi:tRNA threonylcarbamoyl adenosine modification protein (Sua5/YciO/YrdC/YwlC family)